MIKNTVIAFFGKKQISHQKISPSIWALSASTFFLNLSSTIVFVLMPTFLTLYCKVSCSATGALEGIAEGFALFTRAITGMISDAFKKRRNFLLIGYLSSLIARMLLAISGSLFFIVGSRLADKFGNGIQASPREAYISDISDKSVLGRSYGLNKGLGMMGSFLGSVFLFFVFLWIKVDLVLIKLLFYFSVGLVALSTLLLLFGVKDPKISKDSVASNARISFTEKMMQIYGELKNFDRSFWMVLGIVFLFKLGYFSGAFLMLWLGEQNFTNFFGLSLDGKKELASCVVMLLQNGMCAFFSYPMGFLSDRLNRKWVVAIGILCMLASLMCLSLGAGSVLWMTVGILLYGIQMSMQGALMALLSMTMPKAYKGTGFGIFFLISGIGIIVANQFFMRTLWDAYSPKTAFLAICIPVAIALFLLPLIRLKKESLD